MSGIWSGIASKVAQFANGTLLRRKKPACERYALPVEPGNGMQDREHGTAGMVMPVIARLQWCHSSNLAEFRMTLLMVYDHQQRGPWHLVLLAIGCGLFLAAGLGGDIVVRGILVASGSWMCLFAMCFQRLTVRDEGLHLAIRFGPLSLFQRRVAYAELESVQRGRTSWLEGWGIHLSPGGGWTWNLWGFDCVDFYMDGRRKLRVGTDDAERLTQYVQARIGSPNGNAEGHALADSTGETG